MTPRPSAVRSPRPDRWAPCAGRRAAGPRAIPVRWRRQRPLCPPRTGSAGDAAAAGPAATASEEVAAAVAVAAAAAVAAAGAQRAAPFSPWAGLGAPTPGPHWPSASLPHRKHEAEFQAIVLPRLGLRGPCGCPREPVVAVLSAKAVGLVPHAECVEKPRMASQKLKEEKVSRERDATQESGKIRTKVANGFDSIEVIIDLDTHNARGM
ncbi:uncharacterized protein LOC124503910 [Lynx rufus]|uniref:uncharacterized protein LOC124503910 n=1 Tax=Lynx rufus TaxID=61384 RepID=UPI001F1242CF|nr:uncharacterized protein LOC124503910 [Lynx rufus]